MDDGFVDPFADDDMPVLPPSNSRSSRAQSPGSPAASPRARPADPAPAAARPVAPSAVAPPPAAAAATAAAAAPSVTALPTAARSSRKPRLVAAPPRNTTPLLPRSRAPARSVSGRCVGVAALATVAAALTIFASSQFYISSSTFPAHVVVPGCGLGHRLMTIANFVEAGKREGKPTGVLWTPSKTVAASWDDLFTTPLPAVRREQLLGRNYRWTSTEYVAHPLGTKTIGAGREVKSSTGYYADVIGLSQANFVAMTLEARPARGGWAGLDPASAVVHSAGGDISVSVGCSARRFGSTPSDFLRKLTPASNIALVVDKMSEKIDKKLVEGGGWCSEVVGLHLRRGDGAARRRADSFSDLQLVAALKTWPEDVCFFVASDRRRMVQVVKDAVGESRVLSYDYATTALSTLREAIDSSSKAEREIKMATAEMFALGKTTRIIAQPASTFSLVAAWMANIPFANMSASYDAQEAACTDTPAGKWGRTQGLQYPPKCWLPLAEGEFLEEDDDKEDGEDVPEVYDETDGAEDDQEVPSVSVSSESKLPAPPEAPPAVKPFKDAVTDGKEVEMCASKGGILTMRKIWDSGICCPSTCGEICGRAGCAQGVGGYKACCAGKIKRTATMCHTHEGNLVANGCLMALAASWGAPGAPSAVPGAPATIGAVLAAPAAPVADEPE